MKSIKSKIEKAVYKSNGYPNLLRREYLAAIRLSIYDKLSNKEIDYIRENRVNLNKWIMEITKEVTEALF